MRLRTLATLTQLFHIWGVTNLPGGLYHQTEVTLLLVPGFEDRHAIPGVSDGLNPTRNEAAPLKLVSIEQREDYTLWIRYQVIGR